MILPPCGSLVLGRVDLLVSPRRHCSPPFSISRFRQLYQYGQAL